VFLPEAHSLYISNISHRPTAIKVLFQTSPETVNCTIIIIPTAVKVFFLMFPEEGNSKLHHNYNTNCNKGILPNVP
jgi:hypothetical protein